GVVTLVHDARVLDGSLAMLEKLAPQAGDQLRRSARHLTPLTLRAALAVDPGAGGSTAAKVKIDGRAGALRVALQGEAGAAGEALRLEKLAQLGAGQGEPQTPVGGEGGGGRIELNRLCRVLPVAQQAARATPGGQ